MTKFPDCFPANFEENILPKDVEFTSYPAYRILKRGILDHQAFLSTYEEAKVSGFFPRGCDLNDPGTYSTSVFQGINDIMKLQKIMFKHHPRATIACGSTEPSCGPCKTSKKGSHIDWWIYKDTSPELYFKEVQEDADAK